MSFVKHYAQLGGMDYTTRPHLLNEDKWRLLSNIRCRESRIEQVAQPVLWAYAKASSSEKLLALVYLPVQVQNTGVLLGLTATQVLRIEQNNAQALTQYGAALTLDSDTTHRRWSTFVHNNFLFFVNELNPVRYTDGIDVRGMGDTWITSTAPAGRYVIVYFDHLVIGAPTANGVTSTWDVQWSHLNNYNLWTPGTASEADRFKCTEYQRDDDLIEGLTGLELYKNLCLIFTYSAVYVMRYTGLPRVVRVDPLITDYGSGFRFGTKRLNDAVVWVDTKHEQFCAFRGNGVEQFGNAISDYFFNDISANPDFAQRLWVFTDQRCSEVGWVYPSVASVNGECDKAVVFNYSDKIWSVRTMQDVHCRTSSNRRAVTANAIKDPASSYVSSSVLDLAVSSETFGVLWGGKNTMLLTDETSLNVDADVLTTSAPVLETGDFVGDSVRYVKEVRDVLVHASAQTFSGVKVEICGRKFLDDNVNYSNVGTWTASLKEELLTIQPKVGKVLRYRFTPVKSGTAVAETQFTSEVPTFTARMDMPSTTPPTPVTINIGGSGLKVYTLELQIRAVVELQAYSGGIETGYVSKGGTSVLNDATIVKLSVNSPAAIYYLNNATVIPTKVSRFLDYRFRLQVTGGTVLTLEMYKTLPIAMYVNDEGGSPPLCPGATFTGSEFCQIDMVTAVTEDVILTKGGNVRGFIWSVFEDNINTYGAHK